PNPAHKRSGLLKLSPAGEMVASRVSMENSSFLGFLAPQFSEGELQTACAVMDRLGESIREYCAEQPEQKPAELGPAHVLQARPSQPKAEFITEMPVNLL